MPKEVEDCVKALMKDPDFKPKNPKQGKRSAAYAVCTAQHKERQKKSMGYSSTFGKDEDADLRTEHCICPGCGYQIQAKADTLCEDTNCPECKTELINKEHKSIPMRITKATIRDGSMYWQGVVSDDDWDKEDERLDLSIFSDFKYRLDGQKNKADYEPPFVSLSHYGRLGGKGERGVVEDVWTHGRVFKAEGWFNDDPLSKRCFEVVRDELERIGAGEKIDNPVRFSIAFLPRQVAKDTGRTVYLKGILDHVALTRVPVNPRTGFTQVTEKSMTTKKEDALSIVGEDKLDDIEEIDELQHAEKSEADDLVIKAEDEAIEEHKEQELILRALLEDEGYDEEAIEKAQWDYSYKKALPDSAYAYVDKGCKKEDGKTQQSCRHLPYKDKSGSVDCGHVRAALQAVGGARTGKKMSTPSGVVQKLRRALKGCQKSKAEILETELTEYEQGRIDGYNAALDLDIRDNILEDEVETMTEKQIDLDAVIKELKPEEPAEEVKAKVQEDPVDRYADLLKQLVVAEGYGRSRKLQAGEAILRSLAAYVSTKIDETTPASPEDIAKSVVDQVDEQLKPVLDEIAVLRALVEGKEKPESPQSKALSFEQGPTKPEPKESFYISPYETLTNAQGMEGGGGSIRKLARQGLGLSDDQL